MAALYSENATNHGRRVGREGLRRILKSLYVTFPDWHFEVEDIAAGDDSVWCSMIMTGTHRAMPDLPILGGLLLGVPPTGRPVTVPNMHVYRIADGQITEHHAVRDDLGMMQQLGLLPATSHAAGDLSRRSTGG